MPRKNAKPPITDEARAIVERELMRAIVTYRWKDRPVPHLHGVLWEIACQCAMSYPATLERALAKGKATFSLYTYFRRRAYFDLIDYLRQAQETVNDNGQTMRRAHKYGGKGTHGGRQENVRYENATDAEGFAILGLGSKDARFDRIDERLDLEVKFPLLGERERKILKRRLDDKTLAEIGKEIGMCESNVSLIQKATVKKLQELCHVAA